MEGDPIGLAKFSSWGTTLIGMVKGYFELVLLEVYFLWCISGILYIFASLIETIGLAGVEGILIGLILPFIYATTWGVSLALLYCNTQSGYNACVPG